MSDDSREVCFRLHLRFYSPRERLEAAKTFQLLAITKSCRIQRFMN